MGVKSLAIIASAALFSSPALFSFATVANYNSHPRGSRKDQEYLLFHPDYSLSPYSGSSVPIKREEFPILSERNILGAREEELVPRTRLPPRYDAKLRNHKAHNRTNLTKASRYNPNSPRNV